LSSADLRRFAAALQDQPSPSSSTQVIAADTGLTSREDIDDEDAETDSSRADVAMETADDVAMDTTPIRRHDLLKTKKRALLAELAQKRQQTVNDNNNRFDIYLNCSIITIKFLSVINVNT